MIDPVQVSKAASEGYSWVAPEYSSVSPFAPQGDSFLLQRNDHFALYSPSGFIRDLPLDASSRPRWMTDNELSYFSGNSLMRFDGAQSAVLRTFKGFSEIDDFGEGDVSNNQVRCVVGDQKTLFLYDLVGDKVSGALQTESPIVESMYVTPSGNHVIVSFDAVGSGRGQGMELYDSQMRFIRQLSTVNGHKDTSTDLQCREVLVWTNSADPNPPADGQNAICLIDLETGKVTPLLRLDWSLAVHISCPTHGGFCYVSTEQALGGPDCQYQNQILRVWFDGHVQVVCDHKSQITNYNNQPKVTCDRLGHRALFASNYGKVPDSLYVDSYLLDVD